MAAFHYFHMKYICKQCIQRGLIYIFSGYPEYQEYSGHPGTILNTSGTEQANTGIELTEKVHE